MAFSSVHPAAGVRVAAGLAGVTLAAAVLTACTTGSVGAGSSLQSVPPAAASHSGGAVQPGDGGTASGAASGAVGRTSGDAAPSAPSTAGPSGSGQPSGSASPKTVPVQITIHDWNAKQNQAEVDAFVPGEVIPGGSCKLILTRGGDRRVASHPAVTTPSSTSCGLMTIPGATLSAGDWQAVVRFQAPTASGASDPVTIRVPA